MRDFHPFDRSGGDIVKVGRQLLRGTRDTCQSLSVHEHQRVLGAEAPKVGGGRAEPQGTKIVIEEVAAEKEAVRAVDRGEVLRKRANDVLDACQTLPGDLVRRDDVHPGGGIAALEPRPGDNDFLDEVLIVHFGNITFGLLSRCGSRSQQHGNQTDQAKTDPRATIIHRSHPPIRYIDNAN